MLTTFKTSVGRLFGTGVVAHNLHYNDSVVDGLRHCFDTVVDELRHCFDSVVDRLMPYEWARNRTKNLSKNGLKHRSTIDGN